MSDVDFSKVIERVSKNLPVDPQEEAKKKIRENLRKDTLKACHIRGVYKNTAWTGNNEEYDFTNWVEITNINESARNSLYGQFENSLELSGITSTGQKVYAEINEMNLATWLFTW